MNGKYYKDEAENSVLLIHLSGWTEVSSLTKEEIINMNYFPGSPTRPTVAFHVKLLSLCSKMYDIGNMSNDLILKVITSEFHQKLPRDVYDRFSEALRFFKFTKHMLLHGESAVTNTKCPACTPDPSSNASLFKVCDGNIDFIEVF
jgi:hypothetical protein